MFTVKYILFNFCDITLIKVYGNKNQQVQIACQVKKQEIKERKKISPKLEIFIRGIFEISRRHKSQEHKK